MEIWKLTLWNVSAVNNTFGHNPLGKSLSIDKGFLRAWNPQTHTHRPQPRQRRQQHQRPRPPHLPPYQPPSRTHHFLQLVPLDLPRDSPRVSLQNILFRDIKSGRGNSSSNNWLSVHLGRTNVFKHNDALFWHASKLNSKDVATRLLHGGFIISFMKIIIILVFTRTDLSASNNVIMMLSRLRRG